MSAATSAFPVSRRSGLSFQFPVAASTILYQGTFAALNASNQLVAATDAAARRVVGLMAATVDNSAGSAADLNGDVECGLFLVTNGSNALTDAHIGRVAYIEDDNSVGSSGGTNFVSAGIVAKVETAGVWLFVGVPARTVAPVTVALTSTNGTAAAAADLAALKVETEKSGDDVRAIHAALVLHGLLK
jgi:hypothetical protein